jgi:two-component system OmpR family sensor kinase
MRNIIGLFKKVNISRYKVNFKNINRVSIKIKIAILFSLSLLLMVTFRVWLSVKNEEKNSEIIISNYLLSSKEILPLIFNWEEKRLKVRLKELGLKRVDSLSNSKKIFHKSLGLGEVVILKNPQGLFLEINYLDESHYFFYQKQEVFKEEEFIVTLFFIFDILLLAFIYISVLKIVSPIKKLSVNMERFAKGDFNITMVEDGAKEILILSKSFNKMARDLKESFEDRENLIRYFGHEIRTPLAKAKYALEQKNVKLLKENLIQIEKFVNDVLTLHLIKSDNFKMEKFMAHTLIVEALNRVKIFDEDSIEIALLEDFQIKGDLYYLSIAVKNLIDNAIKYTVQFPIKIVILYCEIHIISYGNMLKESLDFYLKPFNKESKSGLGLGLSLVELILKEHSFYLDYKHQNGENIFIIKFR